jgi:hypothetical protein
MRILILQANPDRDSVLQLSREVREIKRSLPNTIAWELEIIQEGTVQANDLQEILLHHRPDIVHFSGHGSSETGNLVFEREDGTPEEISMPTLSGVFSRLRENISCVVLNACYSLKQAKEIAKSIPYVIGMSGEILDHHAIAFSSSFYQALAYGKSIDQAFHLGREHVALVCRGEAHAPEVHCEVSRRRSSLVKTLHPAIHAEFDLDDKGKPDKNNNDEYGVTVFVTRFPRSAHTCVYQYIDEWYDSIGRKHQFNVIPNDRKGFECERSFYGNVLIRATLWSTEGGLALQSYLTEALHRHYGGRPSPAISKALKAIERY